MSPASGPNFNDDWLYADDAVAVGLILFKAQTCRACGRRLPACTDYFTRDERVTTDDKLKPTCKRCTRARYRESDRKRKQRDRDAAKAARCAP